MFDQIKNFFINNLVQQLQNKGYNISPETVQNALANAPHLAQEIEGILTSNSQDRMQKITDLINRAAKGELTGTADPANQTTTPKNQTGQDK